MSSTKSKSGLYHNIENELPKNKPVTKSMGALPINPNRPDRIAEVLENIQKQCGVDKIYNSKIVFSDDGSLSHVTCEENEHSRKYIIVTADGLPYKQMIKLIKYVLLCATCGKKLSYIADVTDHMKTHRHMEFYQKFGNILPNVGQFHYSLTMLRSYVKLVWDINFSELCKSVHFESPKAQIVQQKVTDFHKSLDTFRISYEAKLRELAYPFVQYAIEHNVSSSIESFYMWKKFFVKNQNYNLVHDLEEIFGTSFSLYHSSLRANNFGISEIAKRTFSPLFHINNNTNYSVIDIHTDYVDMMCKTNAPELHQYLSKRKCTNNTGTEFNSEPYDERHEEFNKRGLNMFDIRNIEDFQKAFLLVDEYDNVKSACFEDMNVKPHGGVNSPNLPNYEPNITKMRKCMRKNNYLNDPYEEKPLQALVTEAELSPVLLEIKEVAKKQRSENILNVIRYNEFESGSTKGGGIKIFNKESDMLKKDKKETQVEILIAAEEDIEKREFFREYFEQAKKHDSFSYDRFIDDIIHNKFSLI